jgi:predicted transcriptional regulator
MSPRPARDEPLPRPTDAELDILAVLWRLERATVREVHEQLERGNDAQTGYTTTLKLLQIMHGKGLVERDESQRAHVYSARRSKQDTQDLLLGDLTRRAFDDSPALLALQALGSTKHARPEELAQIRALLERLARKER